MSRRFTCDWITGIGVLSAVGALLLAAFVAERREINTLDEGYFVYNAWASLGPTDAVASRQWLEHSGYVLGLPYLFRSDVRILDLRFFSLALWLSIHAAWFLMLTRFWDVRRSYALWLFPLSLFSCQIPLISYQSGPALFGTLGGACFLAAWLSRSPRARIVWGILYGAALMGIPLTYSAALSATTILAAGAYMLLKRPGFRLGLWIGLVVGACIWAAALPIETVLDAAEERPTSAVEVFDSPLEEFGGVVNILVGRGRRGVETILLLAAVLMIGEIARRLWRWSTVKYSGANGRKAFQRTVRSAGPVMVIATLLVFAVAWISSWRQQATLIGYLTLLVLAAMPVSWRIWQEQKAAGVLLIVLVLHPLLPLTATSAFGTVNYFYYLSYAGPALGGLLLLPGLASPQTMASPYSSLPWRTIWMGLMALTLMIGLTAENRGANALETDTVWEEPGLLNGLYMTSEKREMLLEIDDLYTRFDLEKAIVFVSDYAPLIYCMWNRPAPFSEIWRQPSSPKAAEWFAEPANRPLAIIFRIEEQTLHHGPHPEDWLRAMGLPQAEIATAHVHPLESGVFVLIKLK